MSDHRQSQSDQKKRKQDILLAALKTGRKWSKGEIWTELGIWNSGNLVMLLRREGHDIKTEMVTKGDVTYALYYIPKAVEAAEFFALPLEPKPTKKFIYADGWSAYQRIDDERQKELFA